MEPTPITVLSDMCQQQQELDSIQSLSILILRIVSIDQAICWVKDHGAVLRVHLIQTKKEECAYLAIPCQHSAAAAHSQQVCTNFCLASSAKRTESAPGSFLPSPIPAWLCPPFQWNSSKCQLEASALIC